MTRHIKTFLKLSLIASTIFICNSLHSQSNKKSLSDSDKKRITEEIRQLTYNIFEAGNKRDADALYSNFSDATTGVANGAIFGPWKEHVKEGRDYFARVKELRYTIDSISSISVITPDVAILVGTYSMNALDDAGNRINSTHAWTYVFNRMEGKWKIVHVHASKP